MFICWILKIKEFLLGRIRNPSNEVPNKVFQILSCIAQHSKMVKSKDFERPKSDTGVCMGGDFVHTLSYSRTSTWRLIVQCC